MHIVSAKAFLGRLGVQAVSPKDDAARVKDERDEDSEDSEFRREAQRKQGRGLFVDKIV